MRKIIYRILSICCAVALCLLVLLMIHRYNDFINTYQGKITSVLFFVPYVVAFAVLLVLLVVFWKKQKNNNSSDSD